MMVSGAVEMYIEDVFETNILTIYRGGYLFVRQKDVSLFASIMGCERHDWFTWLKNNEKEAPPRIQHATLVNIPTNKSQDAH